MTTQEKHRACQASCGSECGAILLEVVLALALFVGVAAVVAAALNSSLDGVARQKLSLHAANLAVSVIAEVQMGARSIETTGPDSFGAPFASWTWQLAFTPAEDETGAASGLTRVEVVVRNRDSSMSYRLAQVLKLEKIQRGTRQPEASTSF